MESYFLDWANLLLRWLHVITAIAWIGSSFYFVFLDSSLVPPADDKLKSEGVTGELWAVHGGGFYHPVKYAVSPPKLPPHLHWFFWEAYSTWLSGFALFTVVYLWNASTFLVDKSLMPWAPGAAIAVALSFLVVFWMLYDGICQVFGQRRNGDAIVGALVLVLVCIASWLACHWFAGRAAFLLVGAMIATSMSANVFFWIIPGQRKVIKSIEAGQKPDPIHGWRGKQRSVHNTYFTLPVLFAMLSNHYGFLYASKQNWLVLIVMMFAGAAIRQFFVMRHGYKLGRNAHPAGYALVGVAVIAGTIAWLAPDSAALGAKPELAQADFSHVQKVVEQRCYMCHSGPAAMKNVRLDSADGIKQHAQAVYQQAVVAKTMPLNNATQITDSERALIGQWFESGAKVN
ncbi:urate hydroxylase PuuD [Ramlibacter sp. G-1-2-2]|uniref:Urate hydroxylase PuuD n=1 Tax=Ramlibacter agri TaxID=2728837 RepID=A0A848H236_9BURK|nr:urate hydroxylase PuuD [Ramlibacter agri]NML43641.1 urate hydroxylase PuuD [Ramlibacter agri]